MALISCPDCDAPVSSGAAACPRCGLVAPGDVAQHISTQRDETAHRRATVRAAAEGLLVGVCGTLILIPVVWLFDGDPEGAFALSIVFLVPAYLLWRQPRLKRRYLARTDRAV